MYVTSHVIYFGVLVDSYCSFHNPSTARREIQQTAYIDIASKRCQKRHSSAAPTRLTLPAADRSPDLIALGSPTILVTLFGNLLADCKFMLMPGTPGAAFCTGTYLCRSAHGRASSDEAANRLALAPSYRKV
jgi:hypothetical protein